MTCAPHPLTGHPKAIKISGLPLDFLVQLQHCTPDKSILIWKSEAHIQGRGLSFISLTRPPGRQQASLRSGSSLHIVFPAGGRPLWQWQVFFFFMEVVLMQDVGWVNLGETSRLDEASSSWLLHPTCTASLLLCLWWTGMLLFRDKAMSWWLLRETPALQPPPGAYILPDTECCDISVLSSVLVCARLAGWSEVIAWLHLKAPLRQTRKVQVAFCTSLAAKK